MADKRRKRERARELWREKEKAGEIGFIRRRRGKKKASSARDGTGAGQPFWSSEKEEIYLGRQKEKGLFSVDHHRKRKTGPGSLRPAAAREDEKPHRHHCPRSAARSRKGGGVFPPGRRREKGKREDCPAAWGKKSAHADYYLAFPTLCGPHRHKRKGGTGLRSTSQAGEREEAVPWSPRTGRAASPEGHRPHSQHLPLYVHVGKRGSLT